MQKDARVFAMLPLIRTRENWTWGIVNIPLIYGHDNRNGINPKTIIRKVAHNAKCYKTPYYALDKSKRYLWFEQDTDNTDFHEKVLSFFRMMGIDVYWHRTMKGYHYITFHLMPRLQYETLIERFKEEFHNGTFYYSLRVIPNKWRYENDMWIVGEVIDNGSGDYKRLTYVRYAMMHSYEPSYGKMPEAVKLLDNVFCISRYEFKGELRV